MADNYDNVRPVRLLTDEEGAIYDQILNDQNMSETMTYWGPTFFNMMDCLQQTIRQNSLDRYIEFARWVYGYRLDPQHPTQITWVDVDHPDLKFVNILSGTANERFDMQVKALWTVNGVDYLPVGGTQYSQDQYIESIRGSVNDPNR
jgi:hypothetical protein